MTTIRPASSSDSLRWQRRDERHASRRTASQASGFSASTDRLPVPTARQEPLPERRPSIRPAASFVAQLLANRLNLADMPRRRRSEREEVEARYLAADPAAQPTAAGAIIRREA
jgi:hypothetical protein